MYRLVKQIGHFLPKSFYTYKYYSELQRNLPLLVEVGKNDRRCERMKLFNKTRHGIEMKENNFGTLAVIERIEDVTKAFHTLEHMFEVNALTLQQYPEYKQHEDYFNFMFGSPVAYHKARSSELDVSYYIDDSGEIHEHLEGKMKTQFYMGIVQFANCVLCVAPRFPLDDLEREFEL